MAAGLAGIAPDDRCRPGYDAVGWPVKDVGPQAMEPLEPPGISPPPRRFRRLIAPPTDRHLSPGRLLVGSLAALCALILLGFGVARVVRTVKRTVDDAPAYRLSY